MTSPPDNDSAPDKRLRILEAALEVCEKSGVDGARMEEVAARAQVSKGTLYRFFESKADLFLATILASYEESLRIVEAEASRGADPRARLEHALDGLTRVLAAVSPRMNVHYQAWGVVAKDPVFKQRLYGFLSDFHAARDEEFAEILREGAQRGVFRPDIDVTAFADGISALLGGFLYRATFDSQRATPQRLRACFDELVRGTVLAVGTAGEGGRDG